MINKQVNYESFDPIRDIRSLLNWIKNNMDNTIHLPLISCICITDNRPEMLLRAILSFDQQNYTNKELIISYPNKDQVTKNLLDLVIPAIINVIRIERVDQLSIGMARNEAIEKSNGEYVCMWDDDDIYHFARITEQYNAIRQNEENSMACILTRILLYHANIYTAYLSFPSYWGSTLLCKKEIYLQYPCLNRNQFEYADILYNLELKNCLQYITANPSLYTSVFHGDNTMKYTTFFYLINRSEPVNEEVSLSIKSQLANSIL